MNESNNMADYEPAVKLYCRDIADTLAETLEQFDLPEYENLWQSFIADTAKGKFYLHFNYRIVNGDIRLQARTNVGMSIIEYMEQLQGQP